MSSLKQVKRMSNTLLRQLAMLRHIPRYKKKITTKQLVEQLSSEGFDIHQRSVQRDLKSLSKFFPELQTDENKDMAGWSWKHGAAVHDFPAIDTPTALTFKLAETFITNLMPPSILHLLKPYFECSDNVLAGVDRKGLASWSDKVRILPRTMPLIPAEIKQETVDVIYSALLDEKQFRGRYRRRNADEAEYILHPQGLVFRDSAIYLVATAWGYDDPRHYALHRFTSCELLDDKLKIPADFTLDNYLDKGSFQYGDEGNIKLTVLFSKGAANHLHETPLSDDQNITVKKDGTCLITATVNDGLQLRWWLLGFGDEVEIVKPKKLREEFKEISVNMFKKYSKS